MSLYSNRRKLTDAKDQNIDRHDFSWETENVPILHDGFTESLDNDPGKSVLSVSVYMSNGSYRARVVDRRTQDQAFLVVGTLAECWREIEHALKADSLDWTPMKNGFSR